MADEKGIRGASFRFSVIKSLFHSVKLSPSKTTWRLRPSIIERNERIQQIRADGNASDDCQRKKKKNIHYGKRVGCRYQRHYALRNITFSIIKNKIIYGANWAKVSWKQCLLGVKCQADKIVIVWRCRALKSRRFIWIKRRMIISSGPGRSRVYVGRHTGCQSTSLPFWRLNCENESLTAQEREREHQITLKKLSIDIRFNEHANWCRSICV